MRMAVASVGILIAAIGIAACAEPSPSPAVPTSSTQLVSPSPSAAVSTSSAQLASPSATPAPVDAAPLTPVLVEARLRTLDAGLTLAAWYDDRDMGEYPKLVFRATTTSSTGDGPRLNAVLVYPSVAARLGAQGDFHDLTIQGPHGVINWDGTVHSEWVGVENVIVEVVMPGGTFGGRAATPSENAYPGRIADALSRP